MSLKIVAYATADWHIPEERGGGSWKALSGVGGDALFGLQQVVELCVKSQADLWAAGDLFDGPSPDPEALEDLYSVLRPLTHTTQKIYYILGNHDAGRDWLAPLGPAAVRVSGQVIPSRVGYTITGADYTDKELFRDAAGSCAKTDVGLYHQTWSELAGGGRCTLADLPEHRLAVCGDVHVRKTLAPARGPHTVVSPGPLAPQSVAEFAPHATFVVYEDMAVAEVPLRGRQYRAFEVESAEDADAVISAVTGMGPDETLPHYLRAPMISVRVTGDVDGFEAALDEIAAARGVVTRFYSPSSPKAEQPGRRQSHTESGLASVIINWDADPAAKQLAARLVAPGARHNEILLAEKDAYGREAARALDQDRTA